MLKDIVVIGTGGFGREVMWLLSKNNKVKNEWNILGYIDNATEKGTIVDDYAVIGNDQWLMEYENTIYAVCGIANSASRRRVVNKLKAYTNIVFPIIIAHDVLYSDRVTIGEGSIICSGSILTVDIHIGEYNIINLDCTIGHDVLTEGFVTLYPSVNVSGSVVIGEASEIGTGTQIIQGKQIGVNTIIGAGSVVIRDIPDRCTAVGNPCKVIKIH
jgi:sugar O-acyltransferase (sialic acid O-acetyltransferase NeuD family)